jgi:hypothetical protein
MGGLIFLIKDTIKSLACSIFLNILTNTALVVDRVLASNILAVSEQTGLSEYQIR